MPRPAFALLLALALPSAAAAQCHGTDLRASLTAEEQAEQQAALDGLPYATGNHWLAEKDGEVIHLIGTIHLGDARLDPVVTRLAPVIEAAGLSWQSVERFGQDYADTLAAWDRRFQSSWSDIQRLQGFDERFRRMWRFYLGYCEAGFRSGRTDVIQLAIGRD